MADIKELEQIARRIRYHIVDMVGEAGSGHPGGSLSSADIMSALYFYKMNIDPRDPKKADRDRFVLSKGHAAPVLYSTLAEKGFFPVEDLLKLRKLGSYLQGHPDMKKCPGVDASTGSLGQGISIATGMALGAKTSKNPAHVYVLCGDGEAQEGLVWEACEAAAHYGLDNLTVIFDINGLQIDGATKDVMDVRDIAEKTRAFGFDVVEIDDANDMSKVVKALDIPAKSGMPRAIIAHTLKGKGVSFMENQAGWHGKAPNAEERALALKELEG